jgi:anti-sigma B factor antagonist
MADDVVLEVEALPAYTVISASGYLDVSTSPRLRDKIVEVAATEPKLVIVDLGPIEFIDSSALGVILHGWKVLQAQDATLVVVSPQARITKLFEITALNLSIKLYPSTADAVAELVG